jgi:hypothetical protein
MKKIDYSPIDENIFITVTTEGYIRIIENENHILCSTAINDYTSARYVSFSHDSLHVIFNEYSIDHEIVSVIPYQELLHNNINEGRIFSLKTDNLIINFVASPNNNHVAIFFSSTNMYSDPINGEIDISGNVNKYFLHIYEFTRGNLRLIFQKDFDNRDISFTLSEFNTIAIASTTVQYDEDEGGNELWEIAVYNIITGNRVFNHVVDYSVRFLQYLPQIEPNYNKLLLIKEQLGNTAIKIFDLEDNFREISNVDTDKYALCMAITKNGHIAIGTGSGLYYYTSLDEEPLHLFDFHMIQDIAFSLSGQKVGLRIDNNDDNPFRRGNYYDVVVVNLTDNTLLYPRRIDIYDEEWHQEEEDQEDEDQAVEEEIVIHDPELDDHFIPPTNPQKLKQYANKNCFDIINMNEENIGQYLSANRDNIVIFFKHPSDADFLATCLTFTGLKKYLKDPKHGFYRCIDGTDDRTYHENLPEYIKISSQSHTIFVNYADIKQKYIQRQNMIFLEYSYQIAKTISYDASITMNFISSNHCQEGSIIDVYRIIF